MTSIRLRVCEWLRNYSEVEAAPAIVEPLEQTPSVLLEYGVIVGADFQLHAHAKALSGRVSQVELQCL
jgi:hypothetical protein